MGDFWSGFEKQAKKEKTDTDQKSFTKNVLLAPAGAVIGTKSAVYPGLILDKNIGVEKGKALAKDLSKSMGINTKTYVFDEGVLTDMGSHYDPGYNQANAGSRRSLISHELGHANLLSKHKNPKVLAWMHAVAKSQKYKGKAQLSGIVASLAPNEKLEAIAPYIPLAVASPLLAEEARASVSGLAHLAKTRGLLKALRAAPALAGAFGTYAALPTALGIGIKKFVGNKKLNRNKRDNYE